MQLSRFFQILPALALSGCAALPGTSATTVASERVHLDSGMLIFATAKGELRYWPIREQGGRTSSPLGTLQNVSDPTAMAAHGDTLAVAVSRPPSIVLYNARTAQQANIPVASGVPLDVAYDRQGNIVTLNRLKRFKGNVIVYAPPQFAPKILSCKLITSESGYIAVDPHGNIYVNDQVDTDGAVIEIPKGPRGYKPEHCTRLPVEVSGYAAGLQVDPKTNSLVVFNNPGECAGGDEANMTIYDKPYGRGRSKTDHLGSICALVLRLGPDDGRVFFEGAPSEARSRTIPATESGGIVNQRTYPDGRILKSYYDPRLTSAITSSEAL
jgi:hypothetical protein